MAEGVIVIGVPREARLSGAGSRIVAEVDGVSVEFAASTPHLTPSPEAFASAFLPVALQRGARLRSTAPLDSQWRQGAERIADRYCSWWNLPRLPGLVEAPPAEDPVADPAPRTPALAFSLGVDSFFSLLRCGLGVRRLVTVHGFDYPAGGSPRREAVERSAREVSAVTGVEALFVETNLRQHPLQAETNWEANHGGALAAIGHLLSRHHSSFYLSSSMPASDPRPWGSHPKVDSWWSSRRLDVRPAGERFNRAEKLRAMLAEPLVRSHLRVCWENRTAQGNCSRCAKCVRTRVTLADAGVLDRFPGFAGIDTLAADIEALEHIGNRLWGFRRAAKNRRLPVEVRRAAARHLLRQRPPILGPLERWLLRQRLGLGSERPR